MSTLKETIVKEFFNVNEPNKLITFDVVWFMDYQVEEVYMLLDFMVDDMYITIESKIFGMFTIKPTERGIAHFTQIKNNLK